MPQLAGEALNVSLEWCVFDKTALWQFVNNGALFICKFECECIVICQHMKKQAIELHTLHIGHRQNTHTQQHSLTLPLPLSMLEYFICPSSVPYSSEWLLNHLTCGEKNGQTH